MLIDQPAADDDHVRHEANLPSPALRIRFRTHIAGAL
jgi:hypothetical protein